MNVHWLISAPGGHIHPGAEILERPYRISLSEHHPSLTLGDYFEAAEKFVSEDHLDTLVGLFEGRSGSPVTPRDITDILIRSEKHGALYHIAGVEVLARSGALKFALSSAISEEGKQWLSRESDTLAYLDKDFDLPYLPKPFFRGEATVPGREAFSMLAAQWFEGFSEWHLSIDKRSGEFGLVVWDGNAGNRWADRSEVFEIYRKSSGILTLYYDARTTRQIHPWRHAAGDFVVRSGAEGVEVRLTTARNYVSIMDRISGDAVHPMIALVYFFLDLVTRMRVDRLDGTGAAAWAAVPSLEAAVAGFFGALLTRESRDVYLPGRTADLMALLKSFDREELEKLFEPLLDLYVPEDREALKVIRRNLTAHAAELHRIIQGLRLSSLEKAP
ncbi:MAG: hypothetical protein JRF65_01015 [Deltaproteobacteria bacterium]|nr:hypothetical protein [Deltaproteobacteria bacterium]